MTAPPAIRLDAVTKRFGSYLAVDRLDLEIPPACVYGLLGPNGSGKTTTIRMIMGILRPDEGGATLLGGDPDERRHEVGYLPEERGLYKKMKVLELLTFLAEIRGIARAVGRERAREWLDRLELSSWGERRVEDLSKGMQQKVQFIGTVLHEPRVLVLDEPFSGLDPINQDVLEAIMLEFRRRGATVLFSTHLMDQAERLCERVCLISRGRRVLEGDLAEIKAREQSRLHDIFVRHVGAAARRAMSAMSVVWTVVRREYLQRVRSRWFLFATVGVPLLIALATGVPIWLAAREETADRTLVVVDRSGELGDDVARTLGSAGYTVVRASAADEARLRASVADGSIGSMLLLDAESATAGRARLVAGKAPSALQQLGIRQAVVQAALERQLEGTSVDVAQVLRGGALEIDVPAGAGGGMSDPAFAAAYAGSFVLYMVILIYAVAVMRSVLEEKTSRIVEVILSSLRPWQLMLGKILGVGAVGLTQLAAWALVGGAVAWLTLPRALAARPELAQLAAIRPMLPGPGFLVYFVVFFLCGFFIYSALYAAVGAMCNSDEEAQQAQFPLMLLIVIPVFALVGVIDSPNSSASVVLSLIPFFSPFLMFARAAGGAAPAWQIGLSIVLMVLTVVAVAWLAGRIYRVGILMTGKRPTLRELARWIREA